MMPRFFAFLLVTFVARISLATDVLVFEEFLNDGNANDAGYLGEITTNDFVSGGWKTTSASSLIRYDINKKGEYPNGLACGSVEVEFTNFDPPTYFQVGDCGRCPGNPLLWCTDPNCTTGSACNECYVHILAIYETDDGDYHYADKNHLSYTWVASIHSDDPNDQSRNAFLKFAISGAPNSYLPPRPSQPQDWTTLAAQGAKWTVKQSWNCAGYHEDLTRDVNSTTKNWSSNGTWTGTPRPSKYVFIGKDKTKPLWVENVIYTRVKVTAESPCDCDQGTNTPPRAGLIQVFSADGTRLDNGGPPAHRGDALVLKASVDDSETTDANMKNCRFYLRTAGNATWNMLDAGQAQFVATEPELNWQYSWTVPADAPLGAYDIRFYYEDEGGLSADQTQQNEFDVVALPQDGGADAGVDGGADATADSRTETGDAGGGCRQDSDCAEGQECRAGTCQAPAVQGGCGCGACSSETAGPGLGLFILLGVALFFGLQPRNTRQ